MEKKNEKQYILSRSQSIISYKLSSLPFENNKLVCVFSPAIQCTSCFLKGVYAWLEMKHTLRLCTVWILNFDFILKLRNSNKEQKPTAKYNNVWQQMLNCTKNNKEGKKEKVIWPTLALATDPSMRQIYSGIQSRSLLWAWFFRKLISWVPSPVEEAV